VQAPIAKTVEALNDFQPTVLGGYASGIAALSREALAGRLNVSPRMIGTCAETLTEEMYSDIEEAWPHRQTDAYASSKFPFVAARLCGRSVYSVHDDVNILELLDSRDQPVREGQTGNVVLTNLHNRPLPLIRYRMLDMADRGPDEEEGPFSTVIRFHGRVNDALPILLDNGHHSTLSPVVLCGFAVRGVKKAKFVLSTPNRIEVHYTGERNTDGVVSDEFRKVLAASGAARAMEVVVRRVTELPVDSRTGKFRITEVQTS
jgi:phenylacetate-coenzyme A ligase PaaK-like adenylate-forming protein